MFEYPEVDTTVFSEQGRGCGKERDSGDPYLVCGLMEESNKAGGGVPVPDFFHDPVDPWPKWERGVHLVERLEEPGMYDVVVYIGRQPDKGSGYLSAWDFLQEADTLGTSRKLPKTFEFEKLTPRRYNMETGKMEGSIQYFVHSQAYYDSGYELTRTTPLPRCHVAKKYPLDMWHNVKPGWHPIVSEHELSQCTFGLKDLAYFQHQDSGNMRLHEEDCNTFVVEFASIKYWGNVPQYPVIGVEESDKTPYDEKNWKTGIILSLPVTGIEWKDFADPDIDKQLKELGIPSTVLSY